MKPAMLFSASAEDKLWFRDHTQPHEQLLRAWLQSRFCDQRDIDDVVNETFAGKAQQAGQVFSYAGVRSEFPFSQATSCSSALLENF